MQWSGGQITGLSEQMILNGTVNFSGKETGSFQYDNLDISFEVDPNTYEISGFSYNGSVYVDGVDVTSEFIDALEYGLSEV